MKRRSIIRVRKSPGGYDQYGDPIASTSTETTLDGWLLAPRYEQQDGRRGHNGVIVGLTGYGPVGVDLRHDDQVKVDGALYTIVGEPGDWIGESAGGVEVALKRVEG